MQVVGYVRESPGDATPVFSQGEAIRRWAEREGHKVVALFQDRPGERSGYRALLSVLDEDDVEAVVVAGVKTLSADLITQEVMIWHARCRGKALASTETGEAALLAHESTDQTRNLVRHVLAKRDAHDALAKNELDARTEPTPDGHDLDDSVLVELVPRSRARAS